MGMAFVWTVCCSMVPGSGRIEALSISALHSGQLSILFIYWFVLYFHAYLSLAVLMASCYEIVLCVVIALACYMNLCIVVGYGVMYMVVVAYIIGGQGYILPHISDWGVWHEMPLEVVCNNHSPAPIYGGYLPWTGVYCDASCAPGAVSACCTWHMCIYMYVLWSLERSWCCQSLLHLAYVYVL